MKVLLYVLIVGQMAATARRVVAESQQEVTIPPSSIVQVAIFKA
ncbi:MAG: hypothetical protein ACYDAI_12840 [Trichloromonadaceae bacterium]